MKSTPEPTTGRQTRLFTDRSGEEQLTDEPRTTDVDVPYDLKNGSTEALWRIDPTAYDGVEDAVEAAGRLLEMWNCRGCGVHVYTPPVECKHCGSRTYRRMVPDDRGETA